MALPEYRWVSVEEYLAIDNASDVRFEYVHGQLRMLAGGSRNLALIAHNLHGLLHSHLHSALHRNFIIRESGIAPDKSEYISA